MRTASPRGMMQRLDVANVIAFLASPLSVALNGEVIVASGGARGSIYY